MQNKLTVFFASRAGIVFAGILIGTLAALMAYLGNPPNMGVCVACFERDVAGALGLHRAPVVQYLRPEVPAFVLGSLAAALMFGEFRARAGSTPLIRFLLGAFAMIGALVFLGCPWRSILRLAGGDLNAIVGIAGLATGIGIGGSFIKNGFTLGRARPTFAVAGWLMPALMIGLLALAFGKPAFIFASEKGPGSMHAPLLISLGAGLLIGFIALISAINALFATLFGLSFQQILGYVFYPLAWLIGIPLSDALNAGSIMATKLVANEFVAMIELQKIAASMTPRGLGILSVFLVSFANFASIGIIAGAIKGLNEPQGNIVSRFGLRLVYSATLVSLLSASFAGLVL